MASGPWGGALNTRPLRVKVRFSLGNEQCQTGFNLRRTGASFEGLEDIATDVGEWANTNFRTILSNQDRLQSVDVVDVQSKEGAQVTFVNVAGTQNTSGGKAPSILQVPVSFKSAIRARYGQGRGFWPVAIEEFTNGNVLADVGAGIFQNAITALGAKYMQGDLTGALQLINFHGPLLAGRGESGGPPKPAVPAMWYDVTTIRLGSVIGALRSRKQGIGS